MALWAMLGAAMALAGGCGGGDDDSTASPGPPPSGGSAGGGGSAGWTVSGTPPAQTMVNVAFSFTPTVTNPNSASLTFSYQNLPSWASVTASTGNISGTPGAGDVGTASNIRLTVTDGTNTYTSPAYSITVVATASGSTTLQWMPPTTYTDGSSLNSPSYRVYYGTAQGSYPNVRTVPAGVTAFVVDQLTPGTYYFVMTSVDSRGVESVYSNTASKVVN
jgi:hypothetical protein